MEVHDLPSGRIGPFWFRYFRDMNGLKRMAVITKALKHQMEDRFGNFVSAEHIILAPNGVELERFEKTPAPTEARKQLNLPEALTVACTGHLYQGRGVDTFIELAKRLSGVRFVWAGGRPEDVEHYRQLTAEIPNITFVGFVPNEKLPLYQAAADVLLMPYGSKISISSGGGNSAQISSPMKMFEYLASGRAMIASDLVVFREVLNEKNAAFCPPDDLNAWEGALRGLLDNPTRRETLAKQARADAAQYSWVERAKRILDGFLDAA